MRAVLAEALLAGQDIAAVTDDLLQDVATVAAGESEPLDDHRASAEYRRAMVGTLTRRLLEENLKLNDYSGMGGV
jgi:carbon-monoxide dehydrogenase medium subunit